ncbi:Ribosome-binding ATPase YchF [Candidatus Burarchaeum australiense]|nr:Ribosome-binding ATPase YchF [Candidatus Burarchaeum australiense]
MLDIGICGKPNSGKSTFFSAATTVDVPIANYPFTTIKANRGMAYVRSVCPCTKMGVKCNPRNSKCVDGTRLVPTTVIDVAGLVPGAHEGKGLGNKFLDDLRNASAIIQVVDASGTTDLEGKVVENFEPRKEVEMLEEEISYWMADIIKRGIGPRRTTDAEGLAALMSGLGIAKWQVVSACNALEREHDVIEFENDAEIQAFAKELRRIAKPILLAANKMDLPGARRNFDELSKEFGAERVIACYADGELALRRAEKAGLIKYVPGAAEFEILGADARRGAALEKIKATMKSIGGTGVQEAIDKTAFGLLGLITVYPVEDEARLADHHGNILPDAFLIKEGSTPLDLAREIHTDLAEKFICAIDVKKGMEVGKDHVLTDGDIIRIVKGR